MPTPRPASALPALGVWLALAGAAADARAEGPAPEPGFADDADQAALEDQLAEQGPHRPLTLRWRVRGSAWDGGALQAYQRCEWRLGDGREVYALAERDPGEPRWPDYAAFYVAWQEPRLRVRAVAGDLLPGWGAGLVFGRSGMGGLPLAQPGTDAQQVGYRSAAETRALRGLWLGHRGSRLSVEGLVGRAWRDARLGDEGQVTSLPDDGQHVTDTEQAGRRLLRVQAAAGRVRWAAPRLSAGVSLLALDFDRRVDLRRPERKPWAFAGRGEVLAAADAGARLGRLSVGGEGARDAQGHRALVAGVRARLPHLRLRAVGRWYDAGFQSFYGAAPSRGGMENERGVMLAAEGRGWSTFVDRYRRPERTYYYPYPSVVQAVGCTGERRLTGACVLRFLVRQDAAPRWSAGTDVAERLRAARVEAEWRRREGGALPALLVRLRLEDRRLGRTPGSPEGGGMASVLCSAERSGWSTLAQLAGFATRSYATRVYEYEYELPGAASVRPLYGHGWRLCALLGRTWSGGEAGLRYRLQRDGRTRQQAAAQVDLWMDPALGRRQGRRGG